MAGLAFNLCGCAFFLAFNLCGCAFFLAFNPLRLRVFSVLAFNPSVALFLY
jgi:hypothetical protein